MARLAASVGSGIDEFKPPLATGPRPDGLFAPVAAARTYIVLVNIFYFGGAVLGGGLVRTIGSYVPITSTVAMPQRLLAGEAWWEPALSLLVTLVFRGLRRGLREAMRAEG